MDKLTMIDDLRSWGATDEEIARELHLPICGGCGTIAQECITWVGENDYESLKCEQGCNEPFDYL